MVLALGFIGELLFNIVVEIFGELILEGTGRLLIWIFTAGRVRARRRASSSSLVLDGRLEPAYLSVSPGIAVVIGIVFWIGVAVVAWRILG